MTKIQHGYGVKLKISLRYLATLALSLFVLFGKTVEVPHREPRTDAVSLDSEMWESSLDKIYSEFSELMPEGLRGEGEILGAIGLREVLALLSDGLTAASGQFLSSLALYVGIAALLALSELFASESGNGEILRAVVALCVTVPLLRSFSSVLSEASVGLSAGCELFGGMIPLLSSVAAAGGGTATATVSLSSMSLTLSLVTGVLCVNLFPLSVMIFISAAVSSFDTGQGIKRFTKSMRTLFSFVLGAATTVLVSTVALQGVITSAKDTLAIRSAKYAIGGMLPAVGGTVGATLGALVSGASVLSSVMGATGAAALGITIGAPLFRVLSYRFAMQLAITFSGLIGAENAERLLDSLRAALDLVLSVLTAALIVFVLETVIFMKAAVIRV